MVTFAEVPAFNLTPGTFLEVDRSGIPGGPQQRAVLLMGYGGSGDTFGTPTAVLGSVSPFARDSMISAMIAAYRRIDALSPITAIALEPPGGGTPATGTIAFTGTATAGGTLAVYVAGKLLQVGVVSGDTAAAVATAVAAAITADPDIPATAAAATGTVTITAGFAGVEGNNLPIALDPKDGENGAAGITGVVTAMAGGAGQADLATPMAAVAGERFYTILSGLSDAASRTALVAEMNRRHGATVQLLGQAFAGLRGTFAGMITEADSSNSVFLTLIASSSSLTAPWEWAAQAAAHDTRKPDPATPYDGLAFSGLDAPQLTDRPDKGERDALLAGGVSTFRVSGSQIVLDRLVTTRSEDDQGNATTALLPLTIERTLQYLRENLRARLAAKFAGFKLAADPNFLPRAGQKIITPRTARAEIIAWYEAMLDQGLVQGREAFAEALTVEVDPTDLFRLNAYVPAELIRELVVTAAVLAPR